MPITVKCEGCGKTLKVKDELAGKRGKCPGCGAVVIVPAPDSETVAIQDGMPDAAGTEGDASADAILAEMGIRPGGGGGERGNCDVCNESIVKSTARVVTTDDLRQATENGYCAKQNPFALIMGFDKKTAWQIALNMGSGTDWALCPKCATEVDSFLKRGSGKTNGDESKSGCFIATACCGTANAPQVLELQAFRDQVMLPSAIGQRLVSLYYRHSPPVATWLGSRPLWRWLVRKTLVEPFALLVSAFRAK